MRMLNRCECGKFRYETRREAKSVARKAHPDACLRAYRCGGWWHIGNTPEHVKKGKDTPMSTIGIDFDGVIHRYSKGWQDGSIYDGPVEGAIQAVHYLMADHAVFVFTTRNVSQAAQWLNEHGINATASATPAGPFWNTRGQVLVTNRKMAAAVYIDDRAIRFTSWPQTLSEVGPMVN